MRQRYYDVGQVRYLFDMLALEIENQEEAYDQVSSTVRTQALQWLAEKQRDYRGDAYHDQVERNAVYLGEVTSATNFIAADYLCKGQPILRPEEILSFVTRTAIEMAQGIEPFQVNFIRFGCSGCTFHAAHGRWTGLRRLRNTARREDYIEELEFCCLYYQMSQAVAKGFLVMLLANHDLAGIAAMLPLREVYAVVEERIGIRTSLYGGLIKPESLPVFDEQGNITGWERQQISSRPKWWDGWGEEFAGIARNIGR